MKTAERQLKKMHRRTLVLLALLVAIAFPAAAHNRTPLGDLSATTSPAIAWNEPLGDTTGVELEPPLPIVDAATIAAFDEAARIEIDLPANPLAELDAHVAAISSPAETELLPIVSGAEKCTSGFSVSLIGPNVRQTNELSLKLHWGRDHVRNRWFDPGTGSWLTPDPLGYQDSSNLYAFCGGDPVNERDPTGEFINPQAIKENWERFKKWFRPTPKGTVTYPDDPREGESRGEYVTRLHDSGIGFQEAAAAGATFFPEQQPDSVMLGAATRGVLMAQKPVYAIYGGLKIASSITGVGAVSLVTEGFVENGVTPETVTMAVPVALHLAVPRTPTAIPSVIQGAAQTDRAITGALDAQRALAQITEQVNAELAANPRLALRFLSRPEYEAATRTAGMARMQYGNAVERMVADRIRQDPALANVFRRVGGPNNPDFIAFGQNYDVTTETMAQVYRHMRRPGYGEGLGVVTYQRPAGFTTFPTVP